MLTSKYISSRREFCVIFGSRKGYWWKRCHGMAGLKVRPSRCPFGKKQWTCIETWIYRFESLLPSEKMFRKWTHFVLIFIWCSLQPSASTSIIRERVWRPEPQLTLQRDQTSRLPQDFKTATKQDVLRAFGEYSRKKSAGSFGSTEKSENSRWYIEANENI